MAPLQLYLAGSVATLLSKISPKPGPAVMPYECCWVIAEVPPGLPDAPLDIDIVARCQDRIETAHLVQDGLPEGHIAAREVSSPVLSGELRDGSDRALRHD